MSLSISSPQPTQVKVSAEEIAQSFLSPQSLKIAVDSILKVGYVILEDVVPHNVIDYLRQKMVQDSAYLIDRGRWNTVGNVTGHLNQALPPFPPYVFPEIISNVFAAQVTQAFLGEGRFNRFYRCNTNVPGSGMQPLHWDGTEGSLVVNVGLEDITEANGSIELWPGTHLLQESSSISSEPVDNSIDELSRESRREICPPIRGNLKKGSILIRHESLWHRGMPNQSSNSRYMVAMMHYPKGTDIGSPLCFNIGCEIAFSDRILHPNLNFLDKPIDYLETKASFSQWIRESLYRVSPASYKFLQNLHKAL